jgi:hypothetical protein
MAFLAAVAENNPLLSFGRFERRGIPGRAQLDSGGRCRIQRAPQFLAYSSIFVARRSVVEHRFRCIAGGGHRNCCALACSKSINFISALG